MSEHINNAIKLSVQMLTARDELKAFYKPETYATMIYVNRKILEKIMETLGVDLLTAAMLHIKKIESDSSLEYRLKQHTVMFIIATAVEMGEA